MPCFFIGSQLSLARRFGWILDLEKEIVALIAHQDIRASLPNFV